ncbi:MAG: TerB family tellurite resistance protein [Gammaproteobacteria bacterium]|nr:TerB family tellurite resistance protein [Gammaproteobacteria bacterium]
MKSISDFFKDITSNKKTNIEPNSLESFKDEMVLCICVLLIEVSKSDDDYDDSEKEKIVDLLEKQFSLNHDQIDMLMQMADKKNNEIVSLHELTATLNKEYTYSEKKNVIKMLWDIAYSDGRIDKYEDYTIRKISDLLYIKHSDFIKAKLR